MVRLSGIACLLMVLYTSSNATAGWPFFAEDGLRRGTPEYFEAHANDPPGSRQKYYFGKVWPVRARPVGPSQTFVHKYHTAHYWPHPYQCQDRATVNMFYDIQAQNGWQTATTFYGYHFDETSNQLNSAGLQHLSWIMSHVPPQYRQAYVAVVADQQANSSRIASVEQSIANAAGGTQSISVQPRVTDPLGRPAVEVQRILEGATAGALPPVIQYSGPQSGGG